MKHPEVLVVEDEPLIAEIIAMLEEGGFAVTVATTGDVGLEQLAQRGGLVGLVTDIQLPGGVSGWELARTARKFHPEIAIVYATGHGENDWPAESVPGSILITKPFAAVQVVAALSGQLNLENGH